MPSVCLLDSPPVNEEVLAAARVESKPEHLHGLALGRTPTAMVTRSRQPNERLREVIAEAGIG